MQCENCRIWEILEPDLFCSWCGKDIFQILVREEPIRLYLGAEPDQNDAQRPPTKIITNSSPNKISLACVDSPPWLRVDPLQAVVEPYKTLDVKFSIDRNKLGGPQFQEGHFVFQPSASGAGYKSSFKQADFEVQLWPLPELNIQPLKIYSADPSLKVSLHGEVDADLNISSVTFTPPILVFGETPPFELKLGDFILPVRLNFSKQVAFKAHNVTYELGVEGLTEPLTGQFELEIRRPATIQIFDIEGGDYSERRIIAGTEDQVIFDIANRGEEELKIKGVQVEAQGPNITVVPSAYPAVVAPGKEASVTLSISVDPLAPARRHWFRIHVECNDSSTLCNPKNLHVSVVDEVHPGFVAVDFGTTDSAVAFFDSVKDVPTNLNLEANNPDAKIYSNVLFTNYFEGKDIPFEWLIGATAKKFGPEFRNRFVKAIKTKAGIGHEEVIHFDDLAQSFELQAEEIIKFIMMELLRLTHVALRQKPIKFILSVPTRFTLRQKAILKEAFEKAARARGLTLDPIETIDESLAAGLFYILVGGPRDEQVRSKKSYTLMILDFGGGTTDVTVFKVHQHLESDSSVKIDKVEIIGAWGDATLGGEGITNEIAAMLAAKFLKRPLNAPRDAREIRKLEDEAEAVKIAVSELKRWEDNDEFDVERIALDAGDLLKVSLDYLMLADGSVDADLRHYLSDYVEHQRELLVWSKDFLSEREVRVKAQDVIEIFERKLKKLKSELEPLLSRILKEYGTGAETDAKNRKRSADDFRVDVMLLAGQSAQFPSVTQIFQDLARQPIDFVRDRHGNPLLKECVSRGALYYISYLSGGVEFEIEGRNRQWTRLGRTVPKMGSVPEFEELIHWGAEYPVESSEFILRRLTAVVGGNTLRLQIHENLTMYDDERRQLDPFETFELKLQDSSPDKYTCKLVIDPQGDVKAFCKVENVWVEMEPMS
jgi:molecular chaperone DnaK (HSP70)